jgi:hypothetical protein
VTNILAAGVRWQERLGSARDKPEMCLYHLPFSGRTKLVEGRTVYRPVFMRIRKYPQHYNDCE